MILQEVGHTSSHDLLGQAFHNGSFAHARVADHEHVGLEPAGQHSDHFFQFGRAAYHGLQALILGQLCEIGTVFVQYFCGLLIRETHITLSVVALIELHELGFFDSVFEQEVVCMAVGFTHHGQVQIHSADGPATGEQHLCECAIETAFQGIGLLGWHIFGGDHGSEIGEIHHQIMIQQIHIGAKLL